MTFTKLENLVAQKSDILHELTDDEKLCLREVLLAEYQVIANFCKQHGLTIFLGGGSCLGAVRHKGFIPWDDDLDVNMPRADYNKLISLIEAGEFPDGYEFSYPSKNHDAKNQFMKIYVKGTRNVEIDNVGGKFPKGVNIDVCPMENVPANHMVRLCKGVLCDMLTVIAASLMYYETRNKQFTSFLKTDKRLYRMYKMRMAVGWLFSGIGHRRFAYWLDRFVQHKHEGKWVTFPSGRARYRGELTQRDVFLPVSKGWFEGIEVNLPNNPDAYLSHLYGKDYLQLPPENKRERHFVVEVKC